MNTEKHENWIKKEQAVRTIEVDLHALEKALEYKRAELASAQAEATVAGCEAAEERYNAVYSDEAKKKEASIIAITDLDGNWRVVERCRRKKGGEEPVYPFRVSERILKV